MNRWDSRRIAFISILIAMSISFVVIGAQAAALSAAVPSFKLALSGLPIKIIGYLFGPITGFITGFITDVLSFVFIPAFYHPLYSVALGVSGLVPGLAAVYFNSTTKKFKKTNYIRNLNKKRILLEHELKINLTKEIKLENKINKLENKISKINNKITEIQGWKTEKKQISFAYWSCISIITVSLAIMVVATLFLIPQSTLDNYFQDKGILNFLKDKIYFIILIAIGFASTIILATVARFKMKEKRFLQFAAIISFVVVTEYANLPIVALADEKTISVDFIASYVGSLASSPIKIWMNLIIISFSIHIVIPIIEKKTNNGY